MGTKKVKKRSNSRKSNFINTRSECDIQTSGIATRSKFNFHYFDDTQEDCQSFSDWNLSNKKDCSLVNLMSSLRVYSEYPLSYWIKQQKLTIYGQFPSDRNQLKYPPKVPHDVQWGRFAISGKVRLAGFIVPKKHDGEKYEVPKGEKFQGETFYYDSNTFYVVFLDSGHLFYRTDKKHS